MPEVTVNTEIAAAPGRVFAELLAPERYVLWNTVHQSWPDGAPAAVVQGATFRQRASMLGRATDITWTVVDVNEPAEIVLDGRGPMGLVVRSRYRLAAAGEGTQLTVQSAFEGGPLKGPMGRMAGRRAGAIGQESMDNLRALVEQQPAPKPQPARRRRRPAPPLGLPDPRSALPFRIPGPRTALRLLTAPLRGR